MAEETFNVDVFVSTFSDSFTSRNIKLMSLPYTFTQAILKSDQDNQNLLEGCTEVSRCILKNEVWKWAKLADVNYFKKNKDAKIKRQCDPKQPTQLGMGI